MYDSNDFVYDNGGSVNIVEFFNTAQGCHNKSLNAIDECLSKYGMHRKPTSIRTQVPTSWTPATRQDLWKKHLGEGLHYHLHCYPEPYERLNTTLMIASMRGNARQTLRGVLDEVEAHYAPVEIIVPIQESHLNGFSALETEFDHPSRSHGDSPPEIVSTRLWTLRTGSNVVLVLAQQPRPPDPACTDKLEGAIGAIELR